MPVTSPPSTLLFAAEDITDLRKAARRGIEIAATDYNLGAPTVEEKRDRVETISRLGAVLAAVGWEPPAVQGEATFAVSERELFHGVRLAAREAWQDERNELGESDGYEPIEALKARVEKIKALEFLEEQVCELLAEASA